MANATTNAILDNIRSRLPGVTDDVAKLEMFNVVDELAREALRVAAPTNVDAEPDTWLSSALWVPNYQVILEGTLARLYAQVNKPWFSGELAKVHSDRYMVLMGLARSDAGAAPTTLYERLLYTLRAKIPLARDADLINAIFSAANKVRVDGLSIAALTSTDTTPANWLPTDKWEECYQSLLYGALAHLYAEVGRPWAAPELAVVNAGQFAAELALLRSDELANPATIYARLVNTIRAQLPTARESVIKLAIFAVADKIRIDALRLTPLVDADTNPTTWIPTDKWDDCYQALLYGTLARLQMQPGQPWSEPNAATANNMLFMEEFVLLRGDDASAPTTVFDRLVNNIRVKIPGLRDGVIKLEIYNTVDKVRREALRLTPLTDADTVATSWLPAGKWDDCYQVVLHGTLARLYAQSGAAWAEPNLAAAQFALYQTELELVRNEQASSAARDFDKLMDMARVRLPGARDNIIKLELFMAVEEFLANSNCWTEEVPFEVNPNETTYYVFTIASASINRLMLLTTGTGIPVAARMPEPGTIQLHNPPSEVGTYKAVVSLSVTEPTDPEGYPELPEWVLSKYNGEILDGVLGRMMSQLAKPYSQPNLASFHMKRFEQGVKRASVEARHGMVYRGQNWAFPQNFAYRRKLQW